VLLAADCLETAEGMASDIASSNAPEGQAWAHVSVTSSDRLTPALLNKLLRHTKGDDAPSPQSFATDEVFDVRWYAPNDPDAEPEDDE